jgi:integrase
MSARIDGKRYGGKRGHGEGSIDQLPSGRWRGRMMVGCRPDGTPDRRMVTGVTRQEVQRKLADLKRRADTGLLAGREKERDTLSAFLAHWLVAIRASVKPATVRRYSILIRTHVEPELGGERLYALKPDAIQSLYASRLASGLSATTVRLIHTTLHKALKDAVEWGYLGYNPVARAKPPRRAEFESHPPSVTELARLLDTAESTGDRLAGLWAVAAYSGARLGELLGLEWGDVDWGRSALRIRRALTDVSRGEPSFDTGKTTRARRVVTLGPDALDALRRHRARQNEDRLRLGDAYSDYGLVFSTSLGTALGERNVIRSFKRALSRAGLRPDIRFHDLRHAMVTTAAHLGGDVKSLSARVGHASVAFTLDRYAHALEHADRDLACAVEGAIRAARGAV